MPEKIKTEEKDVCRFCREAMRPAALVCYRCGRSQAWHNLQAIEFINLFGLVLTFGLLMTSACHVNEAKKDRLTASDMKSLATQALERAEDLELKLGEQVAIQTQQVAEVNSSFEVFFGDLCEGVFEGTFVPNTQICQLPDGRSIKYSTAIPSAEKLDSARKLTAE